MKEYKSSGLSKLSEYMHGFGQAITNAIEAVRPDKLQVFQIAPGSGLTRNPDLNPSFTINGIDDKGRVHVTGHHPVYAKNGSGKIVLDIESQSQLSLRDAINIRDALSKGAKPQDCFKFGSWKLDGEKTDDQFVRGRDLPNLVPVFVYNGEQGIAEKPLTGVFNIAVSKTVYGQDTIKALDKYIEDNTRDYNKMMKMPSPAPIFSM